jgi:stage IV sporulation protein FB
MVIISSVWTGYFVEMLTLFVVVMIHELGHIAAARSYGWRILKLELLPFGGVAETDEWGTSPALEELVVALAGPFHHIWMVLLSFLFYEVGLWSKEWSDYFIRGNLMIAGFNLLPIHPLDGGRILQALLSYVMPYRRSIAVTLWFGMGLSLVLAATAFFLPGRGVAFHLLLIAFFLLSSNWLTFRRRGFQFMRFLLVRREVGIGPGAPIRRVRVSRDERLWKVIKTWYKEKYHVLEVTDASGSAFHLLPEENVLEGWFSRGHPGLTVGDLLAGPPVRISPVGTNWGHIQ